MAFGEHHRGYLPHVDWPHLCQSVTFRLADAVPAQVIASWLEELADEPDDTRQLVLRQRLDTYEDAGFGSCLLGDDRCAGIVAAELHAGDPQLYTAHAWVIMPNHVHILIGPPSHGDRYDLSYLTRAWKGRSARRIQRLCGHQGRLWQRESWDRWIRDETHFLAVVDYIRLNPQRAGLHHWPWVHVRSPSPPETYARLQVASAARLGQIHGR
jgi:hypothetical protein